MSSKNQAILAALDNKLKNHPTVSKEPEWMMSIMNGETNITQSETKAIVKAGATEITLAHFCPVRDFRFGLSRGEKRESVTNDIVPNGLCAHELKIVAPFASINAGVHAMFAHNQILTSVRLIRLAAVITKGANPAAAAVDTEGLKALNTYTFGDVYITGIVCRNDLTCISFRYLTINYVKNTINPLTGEPNGSTAAASRSLFNLATS